MKKCFAFLLAALTVILMAYPALAGAQDEVDMGKVAFTIQRANTAWKADGVISDGEYYEVQMKDSWFSYAWNDYDDNAETLAKSMKQKLFMSWDDTYVYTAAICTVSEFYNEYGDDPVGIWQGCAIQSNLALDAGSVSGNESRLEYGVSLTSDTNELISFVWADSSDGASIGWTPSTDDFTVVNNKNTLIYEVRTPWNAFFGGAPSAGDTFGYCIVWAGGNDYGNYIHAQLASGCTGGSGKNAFNFAQVSLAPAPSAETEPPETDAPAEQTAEKPPTPQTADMLAFVIFASIITAAGAIVLMKSHDR